MSSWTGPRRLGSKATADDDSGLLLYEPFYGLAEKPFSLSTDPRFLYRSSSHAPVFDELLAGVRRREGLVVITGEIGTGKTTLCRSVLAALDRKTFTAFVPDPFVSREDLIKILLVEFGVVAVDELVSGRMRGASRAELSYPLYEFLRSLEPLDAFAVLVIDEAQNLPAPLLEEIRILADLEGGRRLLQLVLIGQPELSGVLRQPHMRQVHQRVTTRCELQPLSRDGVYGYVGHRLSIAGASADRLQFTGEALDEILAASGGVPRVINRLCDRTLQRGHLARTSIIGADLVRAAVSDLQLAPPAASVSPAAAALPAPTVSAGTDAPPAGSALVPAAAQAPRPMSVVPAAAEDVLPVVLESAVTPGPGAGETAVAGPVAADDLRVLLTLPATTTARVVSARLEPPAPHRPRSPHPAMHRPAASRRRGRGWVIASLLGLGSVSGVTLATYWLWAGPLLTQRDHTPPVRRPAIRVGQPLPPVFAPPFEPAGDEIVLPAPVPMSSADHSTWVVQAGAFADPRRAEALVGDLKAMGLGASLTDTTLRNGRLLHQVRVGPFRSRADAMSAIEKVSRFPGIGQPILQAVPVR